MKNLPVYDINIDTIIRGYFNLYFNNQVTRTKFIIKKNTRNYLLLKKLFGIKPKRLSLNRIFVSKPEVKHTNSKAIITIYTFNREKKSLLKKIRLLKKTFSLKRMLLSEQMRHLYS